MKRRPRRCSAYHSPLLVTVEGVPKFRAAPGAYKGHKAIRVDEVIADPSGAAGD